MSSLDQFANEKLAGLEHQSLKRELAVTERAPGARARRAASATAIADQPELISFCCNDYLGLSQDERVIAAARDALERYGAGAGGSRLVTGNHPLYDELEAKLARFKGTEAAMVFGSGYLANIGIIPALAGEGDIILLDELAHACMHGGAGLSPAQKILFRHNDMNDLQEKLRRHRGGARHALIVTEGVFSMDGDLAPMADLTALAGEFDAWLMTDDAHGLGVVGDGRGSGVSADGTRYPVPLQMGTLSKAVGVYGGYLCASRPVVEYLKNRVRSFVYSTGLPPAVVGAAIASLDIIASDPGFCARPVEKARLFAREAGLEAVPDSCIVPIILGDPDLALKASADMQEAGFLVTAIRPPTVPDGTARLRITFAADHENGDVVRLAHLVRNLLPARRVCA